MAAFLTDQLDFIYFFYGLAFILLGGVCFAIAREGGRGDYWGILGAFAVLHGAGEWLDLTALVIGDAPPFRIMRTGLLTASFLLLMEFARAEAIQRGVRLPGRWIYGPLLALILVGGLMGGVNVANVMARHLFAFLGALGASWVFAHQATRLPPDKRYICYITAAGFALYGVAAGVIVPEAPFWSARVINQTWFVHLTGVPIQLVRGLLGCAVALSVWAIWSHMISEEVADRAYTTYLRRQFVVTLAAMTTILVLGWTLTEYLGGIFNETVESEAVGDLDLLGGRLETEMAGVDGMVRALAASPSILALFESGSGPTQAASRAVLDLDVEASGANRGYVFDRSGRLLAISGQARAKRGSDLPAFSAFSAALAGRPAWHLELSGGGSERRYYASYPIRGADGGVLGVAVLSKSLGPLEAALSRFDRPYFVLDAKGVVMLTNRPAMRLRTLWPTVGDRGAAQPGSGGAGDGPMLEREIADAAWMTVDGGRQFVLRRFTADHAISLVLVTPTDGVFASRVMGMVVTLLVALMGLTWLFGRERFVRDHVQIERRRKLQALAQDLRFQATTDPLTSLANRLKFGEALESELARARRYGAPLSLVMFDIDHFKRVNDSFGHPVGDQVLVGLSRLVSAHIRANDLLARWGGEEFIVLAPDTAADMAAHLAENLRLALARQPFETAGAVTCSFGVAEFEPGDTAQSLIARADAALYVAKHNGRNRVETAPISRPRVLASVA